MAEDWPKVMSRRATALSPWAEIIERAVQFSPGAAPETYHAVGQRDYIAIVARTADGRMPVVRQYRPALECFTWELPAGMVDDGETPEACCRRELLEEAGLPAKAVHALGTYAPCTARLSNHVHSFFVEAGERTAGWESEAGMEVRLLKTPELAALIVKGEFVLQLHIGALLLAGLRGHIDLGMLKRAR